MNGQMGKQVGRQVCREGGMDGWGKGGRLIERWIALQIDRQRNRKQIDDDDFLNICIDKCKDEQNR